MTIPDPPWKQRTRPCPFYSQGRCLFSDSCNFLHEVKIKVKQPDIAIVNPTPDVTLSFTQSSPGASSTPSRQLSLRSPPRSPRLSSLLLALGDIIHPDESGEDEDVQPDVTAFAPEALPSTAAFGSSSRKQSILVVDGDSNQDEDGTMVTDDHNADASKEELHEQAVPGPSDSPHTQNDSGELLSPIDMSLAPPLCLPFGPPMHRDDSIDSGYGDGWVGPSPFSLSPPPQPNARRYSTLSLISSPFGSPVRAISPKFGPSASAAWPTSPIFSPAKSKASSRPTSLRLSQLSDDLDSPTDYAREQLHDSPAKRSPKIDEDATVKRVDDTALHQSQLQHEDRQDVFLTDNIAEDLHPAVIASSTTPPAGTAHELDVIVNLTTSREPQLELSPQTQVEDETTVLYGSYYSEIPYTGSTPTGELHIEANDLSSNAPSPTSTFLSPRNLSPYGRDQLSLHQQNPAYVAESPLASPHDPNTPEFVVGSSADTYSPRRGMASGRPDILRSTSPLVSSPLARQKPPILSRQSSISAISESNPPESPKSTKIPFGFRHSRQIRPRESFVTPRPGSAPPIRHRPPALVGLSSIRSNSLNDSQTNLSSPEDPPMSSSRLRPLRLSTILHSSSAISLTSSNMLPSLTTATTTTSADIHSPSSPSVTSDYSVSNNPLLSTSRSSTIPNHIRTSIIPSTASQSSDTAYQLQSQPHSAPPSTQVSEKPSASPRFSSYRLSHITRPSSRLSEPTMLATAEESEEDEDDDAFENLDKTITIRSATIPSVPSFIRPTSVASMASVASAARDPGHAIATPRPTLLFAIASDNVEEVRRVLESGEAGPNDDVGPQSALAFTLTSSGLKNKTEIVKLLLAHGADPSSVKTAEGHASRSSMSSMSHTGSNTRILPGTNMLDNVDAATRYYIARAEAPQTRRASALIHRSFFRPLTKVRYEMVGQDRALEQLFRVLSMPSMAPMVVLLCGPSGHGKSLLARRFGFLLDVPTHTVNMTTLRSTHDIWRSYSMSPYEEPSTCTLADFLIENERKRCVVVLDEIEKTENEKVLSSLLMPWELGRCSFEAGHRHVDVSKVIWLGTSNIGHDLVFEHQASRPCPEDSMTRDEYVDLMGILRPVVSDRLGPSLLSRVTTVLPFVPFTTDEKMAIATEALYALASEAARDLPAATVEKLVRDALQSYVPAEGARSLYRAVSTQLLDTL